jgi:hypothetical protein
VALIEEAQDGRDGDGVLEGEAQKDHEQKAAQQDEDRDGFGRLCASPSLTKNLRMWL